MSFSEKLDIACRRLSEADVVLAQLIDEYGPPDIAPHVDYYQTLVTSIISQQLSVKAAATIAGRFVALFGHFPAPHEVLALDFETLRGVGLSGRKVEYVRDLSAKVHDGAIIFEDFDTLDNQAIIVALTAVKGVGEWTAHMFLMFCMGRLDILATGDLGIRNAVSRLYRSGHATSPLDVQDVAAERGWVPYQTVACWYLWRSLDNKPATQVL